MKIIDLFNMISKGEEIPKKIKYKNKIYEWKEYDVCYEKIMTKKGWVKEYGYVAEENRTYFYLKHCYQSLNDEVEILEEPKGMPEKINNSYYHLEQGEQNQLFKNKINEIIDYLENK